MCPWGARGMTVDPNSCLMVTGKASVGSVVCFGVTTSDEVDGGATDGSFGGWSDPESDEPPRSRQESP